MAPPNPRRQSSNGTARSEPRNSISLRRRSSASRHHATPISGDHEGLQSLVVPEDPASRRKSFWDRLGVHPFRGIWNDIRRRAPYYLSDWTDAWTYRVIPSTID